MAFVYSLCHPTSTLHTLDSPPVSLHMLSHCVPHRLGFYLRVSPDLLASFFASFFCLSPCFASLRSFSFSSRPFSFFPPFLLYQFLQVETGIEPIFFDLQSSTSPFCHPTVCVRFPCPYLFYPLRFLYPRACSLTSVYFCLLAYPVFSTFRFVPYFDREDSRFSTPPKSKAPRTTLYCTPGRSRTRPPRINTVECSCNPCPPSPGI